MRDVYIIGVPLAIVAFAGALLIKNSKMPTKAEEAEQIAKARAAAGAPTKDVEAAREKVVVEEEAVNADGVALAAGPVPVQAATAKV